MATDINDAAQNAKGGEIDRLAAELAELTGEDPADAVLAALRERLEHERRRREVEVLARRLTAIGKACAALPDLDTRSPDEIVGYDEYGAPC